jgi:hypothetical protein
MQINISDKRELRKKRLKRNELLYCSPTWEKSVLADFILGESANFCVTWPVIRLINLIKKQT